MCNSISTHFNLFELSIENNNYKNIDLLFFTCEIDYINVVIKVYPDLMLLQRNICFIS